MGCMASATGIDSEYPSAHRNATLIAVAAGPPARMRTSRNCTPFHFALLIRSPPTSLLIHSSVCTCSIAGIARRSSKLSRTGLLTRPPMSSDHFATSTTGSNPGGFLLTM